MNNTTKARIAGAGCLLGGLLFFLDFTVVGWLARNGYFSQSGGTTALLRTIIWCAVSLLLTGGSLGLMLSGATGETGWRRKLSFCGIVWALLGTISYIVGSIYIYNFPDRATKQFFTPLGSILITIGMMKLAAAVVTANVWRGWRRFVPVLVALYFPVQIPLQATLFLGAGRGPNPFLLGAWGLGWMLLGFAIWSNSPASPENRRTADADWQTIMG